jgi:hypothetical protein
MDTKTRNAVATQMWSEIDETKAEKLNGGHGNRRTNAMQNNSRIGVGGVFKSVVIQIIGNSNTVSINGFKIL